MAAVTAKVLVGPGDGVYVRMHDQGVIGGVVSLDIKNGDMTVMSVVWNNEAEDDIPDTVSALVQWLDMVAAEVKHAASQWVGGREDPF